MPHVPLTLRTPMLRSHSRAYVHHLLHTKEMLALVLLDTHNVHHTLRFFAGIRAAIAAGEFGAFRDRVLASTRAGGLPSEAPALSLSGLKKYEEPAALVA